jgi:plastocyanin
MIVQGEGSRLSRIGRSIVLAVALAPAALVLAVSAFGGASSAEVTTPKVTVNMREFKFALTPKTAKKGAVVFTVVNKGTVLHDFKIAGKKTKSVAEGKRTTLRVTFKKAGRYPYLCTLPGHAAAGMKGTLVVK